MAKKRKYSRSAGEDVKNEMQPLQAGQGKEWTWREGRQGEKP
jgi:hypothetical protein